MWCKLDIFLHLSHLCASAGKDAFCEQVWGCGGMAAQDGQQKQKAWEQRAVAKEADRKVSYVWFY